MGLSPIEIEVLRLLCGRGKEASYQEIKNMLEIKDIMLRNAIAELVRKGFLERKPDYTRSIMVFKPKKCDGLS